MASSNTPSECNICANTFTDIERKPISCPKCEFMSCKKCVQTFLKSISDEPYCMNCKFGWDNAFLFENINKSFINGELKKAKTQRSFELEKARFPESMAELEQFNERKNILEDESHCKTMIKEIDDHISVLYKKLSALRHNRHRYANQLNDIYYIKENINYPLKVNDYFNSKELNGVTQKEETKREFKHPCPGKGCNGIMGKNWKCPVCETHACSKCFEELGKEKDAVVVHECKKENLESANIIRKQTRSCPSCAIPIYKSSGCDQMWCTQCQVAFSWNSGKILKGARIHNPHYYQALQSGNINIARNPGDQICGGLPTPLQINTRFKHMKTERMNDYYFEKESSYQSSMIITINSTKKVKEGVFELTQADLYSFLLYITRNFTHNEYETVNRLRRIIQNNTDNRDIRMRYITKNITETDFRRNLCTRNTKRYKTNELLQIIELFHTVCIDNMRSICNIQITDENANRSDYKEEIYKYISNIKKIREYCNEQFDLFHKNNNLVSYFITDLFEIVSSSDKAERINLGY